jgi:hypothetical protein
MRFSNTVTINRQPVEVFAFLSHFENLPLWNYAIDHTQRSGPGPVGVGSRYVQSRSIPRPAVETFEVTEFEPNHRLAIHGTLGPFRADSSYQLDAVGDVTVLTNIMDLEPSGVLGVLASLAGRNVQTAVAANLGALKSLLEATPPAT